MNNKLITSTLLFLLLLSGKIKTMNPEDIQSFFRECTEEKTLEECSALVQHAQQLDDIARQTTDKILPLNAFWRDSYKSSLKTPTQSVVQKKPECPFCDQFSRPQDDVSNFILERNKHSITMFNRFPYVPLHFLIVPLRHIAKWDQLTPDEQNELMQQGGTWIKKLKKLGVGGAHFYFNLEAKCAGATLPGHIHAQLLSRWDGDRSVITHLLGQALIQNERKANSLLQGFYDFTHNNNESEGTKKLVQVYNQFSRILRSTHTEPVTEDNNCYICEVEKQKNDAVHLLVKRFAHWAVMINRFGYAGGHLRVVSRAHGKSIDNLTNEEREELAHAMNQSQFILKQTIQPDGLNMVISDGRCSGTPFKDHVLCDIVPRMPNDSSTTAIICARPIMEKDVDLLRDRLIEAFKSNDAS